MTHCDQCSAKFTLLKRRHICDACQLDHCSDCLTRTSSPSSPQSSTFSSSQSQYQQQTAGSFVTGLNNFANSLINGGAGSSNVRRNCRKCLVFLQWPVNVPAVAALRVKDLRFYLSRHHINASTCTEKSELTALVVNQLKKYRLQQQQEFQQRQSSSQSNSAPPLNPQQQNYRSNGGASSYSGSQAYSRHSNQPIRRSSQATSVIRDDGIRVQGMSAGQTYNYDSDSIRVYASTRLSSGQGTSNVSPSNSEEDDGFVVIGHGDVPPSGASSPPPSHSNLYSAHCDSSVDSSSSRNVDNSSSVNNGSNGSSTAARQSTQRESGTGGSVPLPNASQGSEEPESSINNNSEQSTTHEIPKSTSSPPVAGAASEEVLAPSESRDTTAPERLPTFGNRASLCELDYIKLDDLADEESVRALTVRQCRVLLAKHRVTATAIIEKEQLVDRVLTLWRSYKDNQKSVDEVPDRLLCKICMEAVIDCVLLECSHMVCCTECGRQLSECPVCRQFVVRCVHTFLA